MSTDKQLADRISQWLETDAPMQLPDRVLRATFERTRTTGQQRGWRALAGRVHLSRSVPLGLGAATLIAVLVIGSQFIGSPSSTVGGPSGDPGLAPQPSVAAPSSATDDLLNRFLEARIAGEGAETFVNGPEEDVPLLYATSSGAPYERAEFERVSGIDWPYGWTAFKARLFAGDTVVEQLFFTVPDGPLGLNYVPDGFGTDIAPTTEDGQPLAVPYRFADGEVTLQAPHPWVFHDGSPLIRLIPEGWGARPTTDGGERSDWDGLLLIADPALVGTSCQTGPGPVDAAALAEVIRSDPGLGASPPVVVSVGGADALMVDMAITAGASVSFCETGPGILSLVVDQSAELRVDSGVATGRATGDRMRLYLFDMPEGSSMRILAMAIVAPEARFESLVEAALPVIDSVELHATPR
jgi:hypothetical protein